MLVSSANNTLYLAIRNLHAYALRSILATLGICIGTAAVVALIASNQLATNAVISRYKSLGTNMLNLHIIPAHSSQNHLVKNSKHNSLSLEMLNKAINNIPHIFDYVPINTEYNSVSYNGRTFYTNTTINTTYNLNKIVNLKLAAGRFFSPLDRNHEKFIVIGHNVAHKLKQQGEFNPLGKKVEVNNNYYTIIGILKPTESVNIIFPMGLDDNILFPIYTSTQKDKQISISQSLFKLPESADFDHVEKVISQQLKIQNPSINLIFFGPQELIKQAHAQRLTLNLLLGFTSSISLIVGGIGIMNIMLVSVIERRREIGIRLAVGAQEKNIQYMFLLESATLSFFGGLLGVVIGIVCTWLIAIFAGWEFLLPFAPAFLGLTASTITGIISGIYPAIKASRMLPIQALKS